MRIQVCFPVQPNPYKKEQIMNPNPNLNGKGRQNLKKDKVAFLEKKKEKKNMSSIRLEIPPSYSAIFYTVRQLRHPVYIPPYISKEITCIGS